MAIDQEQLAIEQAMCLFEKVLRKGNYEEADDLLRQIDVEQTSEVVLLAILTITFHGKENLPQRVAFLARAENRIRSVLGAERADELLTRRR